MLEKIFIKDNLSYGGMKELIDLSLQAGIESREEDSPALNFQFEDGRDHNLKPARINEKEIDKRDIKGLEKMFSKGDFLQDRDEDGRIDYFNFKFKIDQEMDRYLLAAACSFAFRLGLEIGEYSGSILAEENYDGNLFVFERDDFVGMEITGDRNKALYRIFGSGEDILKFFSKISSSFPYEKNGKSLAHIINHMRGSLAMEDLDGQITYLLACKYMFNREMKAYFSSDLGEKLEGLKLIFPEVEFGTYEEVGKTKPHIIVGSNIIENNDDPDDISIYMKSLTYENGNYICHLKTNVNPSFIKSYMILLENGILDMAENFQTINLLKIEAGDEIFIANLNK